MGRNILSTILDSNVPHQQGRQFRGCSVGRRAGWSGRLRQLSIRARRPRCSALLLRYSATGSVPGPINWSLPHEPIDFNGCCIEHEPCSTDGVQTEHESKGVFPKARFHTGQNWSIKLSWCRRGWLQYSFKMKANFGPPYPPLCLYDLNSKHF